jgi:DNA-binding MarR family transcriptional regulator
MENRVQLETFTTHLQKVNRYLRCKTFDNEERKITRVQWLLLRYLYRKPKRTIGQLAAHLDVRQSTMSQMLDRMGKVNLITRQTDLQDARIKLIELTDSGIAFIRETEETWMETLSESFAHFTAEERIALVSLMEKLSQRLPKDHQL